MCVKITLTHKEFFCVILSTGYYLPNLVTTDTVKCNIFMFDLMFDLFMFDPVRSDLFMFDLMFNLVTFDC